MVNENLWFKKFDIVFFFLRESLILFIFFCCAVLIIRLVIYFGFGYGDIEYLLLMYVGYFLDLGLMIGVIIGLVVFFSG